MTGREYDHKIATPGDLSLLREHIDRELSALRTHVDREFDELHASAFVDKDATRHKITHEEIIEAKRERRRLMWGAMATGITLLIGLVFTLLVKGTP